MSRDSRRWIERTIIAVIVCSGDEVLEWNANCLQNISHDAVCHVINASRNDPRLELIVARTTGHPLHHPLSGISHSLSGVWPLTASHPFDEALGGGMAQLPHSQSLSIGPSAFCQLSPQSMLAATLAGNPPPPANFTSATAPPQLNPATGGGVGTGQPAHICGRIEISLCYIPAKRELFVNLHRAYELVPRTDGSLRNPYVKLFLLPDRWVHTAKMQLITYTIIHLYRSEKSRRQSSVLADTLEPVWEESFAYGKLTEPVLMARVLEVGGDSRNGRVVAL